MNKPFYFTYTFAAVIVIFISILIAILWALGKSNQDKDE